LLSGIWVAFLSQPWDGFAYWLWPHLLENQDLANSAIDDDTFSAGEVTTLTVCGFLNASLLGGMFAICKKLQW
jgi:hypothetical protein